ncbi:phosphodiesterase [Salipiger pallidus]|uniref:Phosphodiesterase n=1 Tax=Salipiger pallidus TaxID=1775170 RepID=A0A8J2ZJ26_9RHOB|nr:glycerophosphodiester phosphodiesterase family protein [Salipiger pallidus]GGG70675.1 phosphodiesterase [Salipiger pallidus]
MTPLPAAFLERPIAHRAYHDLSRGRPENSLEAIGAAVEAGYGIEIDLQLSGDGQAMVFHDYDLERLTLAVGAVKDRSAADLSKIVLRGGTTGVPTLREVLKLVDGRVPLLIEVKDQDGALGSNVGPLEAATVAALTGYRGPVALMSFNPHAMVALEQLAPDLPRGLTTCAYTEDDFPELSHSHRERLRGIPDFDRVGASFISHHWNDLDRPRVAELKAAGHPVLCWTIRTPEQEATARAVADNITFEGYIA